MHNNVTAVIGDIHGCYDELLKLIVNVQNVTLGSKVKYIFLGNYVDRGPDSKKVIDYLMNLDNGEHVFLRGNHEDMALGQSPNFEQQGELPGFLNWMGNGGNTTLKSFGFDIPDHEPHYIGSVAGEWYVNNYKTAQIPEAYKEWLFKTKLYHKDDQRTYVHAGIIRSIELESQEPYTLTWIREPFLNNISPKGGYVVHGHTPKNTVELRSNRCNLDTACVFGGVLSAGIFTPEKTEPKMIVNHKGVYQNVGNS